MVFFWSVALRAKGVRTACAENGKDCAPLAAMGTPGPQCLSCREHAAEAPFPVKAWLRQWLDEQSKQAGVTQRGKWRPK